MFLVYEITVLVRRKLSDCDATSSIIAPLSAAFIKTFLVAFLFSLASPKLLYYRTLGRSEMHFASKFSIVPLLNDSMKGGHRSIKVCTFSYKQCIHACDTCYNISPVSS